MAHQPTAFAPDDARHGRVHPGFLIHVVSPGFQRIRHYGLLANRNRQQSFGLCRDLVCHPITSLFPPVSTRPGKATEIVQHAALCPKCKIGIMLRAQRIFPQYWQIGRAHV